MADKNVDFPAFGNLKIKKINLNMNLSDEHNYCIVSNLYCKYPNANIKNLY